MIPKFRIADKRGDGVVIADVSSIDWTTRQVRYINEYNEEEVCPFDDKDCVLMQSTGLKDKNGVEIFEGDVVQQLCENSIVRKGVIEQKESAWLVRGDDDSYEWLHAHYKHMDWNMLEIIGNIHANPELLNA